MKSSSYTAAELAVAARQAHSITQVISLLGLKNSGGRRAGVRRDLDALGIDTGHFRRQPWTKYSSDALAAAVADSVSVGQVLDRLGIPRSGGAHAHISRRIKRAGIDTSHFSHSATGESLACAQFDRAVLAAAADGARSMSEILRRLDVPASSANRADVSRQLRAHGIAGPVHYRRLELDEPTVLRLAAESYSVAEMIRKLGLPVGTSNHRRMLRFIGLYGVDTSHFRRGVTSGVITRPRPDPRNVLVKRGDDASRTPGFILRRALKMIGVPSICAGCGTGETWQGKPLILEVDHVNGNPVDNRRENLRLLCPNCHSQTPTFSGRNRGRRAEMKTR